MAKQEFPIHMAVREGDAAVAHSQFLHELMGRDNPALIGVFLEITPDVGVFRLRSGHACSPLSADSERSPSAWAG